LKKINSKKKTDTWFIDKDSCDRWIYHRVKKHVISARTTFQTVDILDTYEYIPSFGALWSYATGSFQHSPKALSSTVIEKRLRQRGIGNLSYYAPEMHERLFIMPPCMRKLIPVHSYNV
jgi:spermidine synthase